PCRFRGLADYLRALASTGPCRTRRSRHRRRHSPAPPAPTRAAGRSLRSGRPSLLPLDASLGRSSRPSLIRPLSAEAGQSTFAEPWLATPHGGLDGLRSSHDVVQGWSKTRAAAPSGGSGGRAQPAVA